MTKCKLRLLEKLSSRPDTRWKKVREESSCIGRCARAARAQVDARARVGVMPDHTSKADVKAQIPLLC